jgi:hypothetical protein
LFCLATVFAILVNGGHSQVQENRGLPGPGRTSQGFAALPEVANPHPDGVRMLADRLRATDNRKRFAELNQVRHKELTADTAKLVALANEVKADTAKTTKESLSVLELRKVEQIEKLARGVHDLMKATVNE